MQLQTGHTSAVLKPLSRNGTRRTMTRHMETYEPWSVVVVPFPFVDRRQVKRRPAVVISPRRCQTENGCADLGMITDERNHGWTSGVPLTHITSMRLRQS